MSAPLDTAQCMLCGSAKHRVVQAYTSPDPYEVAAGLASEGYFRFWLRCSGCGFHYSHYSRGPNALDKLYSSAYRSQAASWRRGTVEEVFDKVNALPEAESETKARVAWIKKSLADLWGSSLMNPASPPHRLLDIGGATGVFAYQFQDHTWKSYVVDPDENGQFLQDKFGITFLQRRYEAGLFRESFTLISLVFVLEHFPDPAAMLKQVRQDMTPDTLLYIEVPSEAAFERKRPDDDIFNACHLWMFGTESLVRFLGTCGFEVLTLHNTRTKRGHYSLMALAKQQ